MGLEKALEDCLNYNKEKGSLSIDQLELLEEIYAFYRHVLPQNWLDSQMADHRFEIGQHPLLHYIICYTLQDFLKVHWLYDLLLSISSDERFFGIFLPKLIGYKSSYDEGIQIANVLDAARAARLNVLLLPENKSLAVPDISISDANDENFCIEITRLNSSKPRSEASEINRSVKDIITEDRTPHYRGVMHRVPYSQNELNGLYALIRAKKKEFFETECDHLEVQAEDTNQLIEFIFTSHDEKGADLLKVWASNRGLSRPEFGGFQGPPVASNILNRLHHKIKKKAYKQLNSVEHRGILMVQLDADLILIYEDFDTVCDVLYLYLTETIEEFPYLFGVLFYFGLSIETEPMHNYEEQGFYMGISKIDTSDVLDSYTFKVFIPNKKVYPTLSTTNRINLTLFLENFVKR